MDVVLTIQGQVEVYDQRHLMHYYTEQAGREWLQVTKGPQANAAPVLSKTDLLHVNPPGQHIRGDQHAAVRAAQPGTGRRGAGGDSARARERGQGGGEQADQAEATRQRHTQAAG